ncbi:glycosyltransferase [Patulibacter minatonensis]|uniref:glycosyltransferase n=1 Tax=Patulibacter minatonensis TaxID=298163 RepID=UPI0006842835|nr:glycosyltransferase [Patulibacter minatonensis]
MRALHLLALGLLAWTHAGWAVVLRALRRAGRGRVPDDREAAPASTVPSTPVPRSPAPGRDVPTVASSSSVATATEAVAPSAAVPGPAVRSAVTPSSGPSALRVSVVIAAYAEEDAIAETLRRLAAQTWPRERLQIIVACDGSTDRTAERAREAGADLVLELPRGGKHAAQAGGVARADGDVLAFSDANTSWEPDALAELVAAFADPRVGYACGRVTFTSEDGGTNQEGAYWRLEMALRRMESDWWSVTAGNGAIYALRASLWPRLRTAFGHDLALPHQTVRAGMLAVDRPTARASEPMVPTVEGEWRRKRRMMNQMWRVVLRGGEDGGLRGGVLDPRGVPPRYLAALVSHRHLRYASPFLHLLALAAGFVVAVGGVPGGAATPVGGGSLPVAPTSRAGRGARRRVRPRLHLLLLAAHLALFAGAAGAGVRPSRPLLLARYYVLMTASIAAGLADHLRHGTPAGWDPAEGTR